MRHQSPVMMQLSQASKVRHDALDLIRTIARMHYDGEEVDGRTFEMTNDDNHETMVRLIDEARAIVALLEG